MSIKHAHKAVGAWRPNAAGTWKSTIQEIARFLQPEAENDLRMRYSLILDSASRLQGGWMNKIVGPEG